MWFDWSIGNAVLGFIVGCLKLYGADVEEGVFDVKHMVIYAVLAILGNIFAFGVVTPLFTTLFFGGELDITIAQGWIAAVSNATVLIVAGIPILKALAARNARGKNLAKE